MVVRRAILVLVLGGHALLILLVSGGRHSDSGKLLEPAETPVLPRLGPERYAESSAVKERPNPHRMPAIVGAADRDAWLRGSTEEARAVLKQYPADLMDAYEVSTRVNSVKNDDPGLINPVRTRSVA